jgi:hypothetical protein
MEFSLLGLIELFVVFAFALGWGVVELVGLRLDRRRAEEAEQAEEAERAEAERDRP